MVKNGGRRTLEGWKVGMRKLRTGERGAKGTWIRFTVLSQVTLQNELHHDQQAPCTLSSQQYSIHTGHSHLRGTYFKDQRQPPVLRNAGVYAGLGKGSGEYGRLTLVFNE